MHHIKLIKIIYKVYDDVCLRIKENLKKIYKKFIVIDAWLISQETAFLDVFIYWIIITFQYHNHLIGFDSLNMNHSG